MKTQAKAESQIRGAKGWNRSELYAAIGILSSEFAGLEFALIEKVKRLINASEFAVRRKSSVHLFGNQRFFPYPPPNFGTEFKRKDAENAKERKVMTDN